MSKTLKLELLDSIELKAGGHESPDDGLCLMEAVSFIRGIKHSDKPPCVSPVLGAYGRAFNDVLPDDQRQRLKPLIPLLVGTAGSKANDERRAWMATDWLVRVNAPAFLRVAGLTEAAQRLADCAELTDVASAKAAEPAYRAARREAAAAWAAARDAAGDAARAAARAAAWAAAWDAAWDAARDAAWAAAADAARDAAWDAAADAARDAAWDAAAKKLAPVVDELRESAFELYRRMIEIEATPER